MTICQIYQKLTQVQPGEEQEMGKKDRTKKKKNTVHLGNDKNLIGFYLLPLLLFHLVYQIGISTIVNPEYGFLK